MLVLDKDDFIQKNKVNHLDLMVGQEKNIPDYELNSEMHLNLFCKKKNLHLIN